MWGDQERGFRSLQFEGAQSWPWGSLALGLPARVLSGPWEEEQQCPG